MKRSVAGTAVVLLLAACSSVSPTPSATPGAAADQILRLRYEESGSLDPSGEPFTDVTQNLLVSSLTGLDEGLNTVPAIAEAWDVTDEGRHITFHLRGARYSSGEPIVAADFVYGWRRLLDPREPRGLNYILADVAGAADLLAVSTDSPPGDEVIDALLGELGVSAPDERTLEVDLVRPAAWFVAVVSSPVTAPIPESWITQPGATEAGAYISSGPYVLTEWVHDARRTFEPNPMWWGEPSKLTRIEMRTFASDSAAVDAYRRGELDVLSLAEGIGQAQGLEAQARPSPGGFTLWVGFDRLKEGSPTAVSSELRRALSLAVDRETLIEILRFDGPVAGSLIPPGMPGHDPSLESVFDPAEARLSLDRALDDLGLTSADQLDISMVYQEFTETIPAGAGYLKEQWRTLLGINVEVVGLEVDAYVEQQNRHDFDLDWNGWIADYPHPQNYLEPTYTCNGFANLVGYCNPTFDQLLDQAARTGDVADQLDLYADAQRLVVDDPVAIFLVWQAGQVLVAPWVEGLVLTPMDEYPGALFFNQVSITPHD